MIAASNDGRRDRQVKLALYASAGIPDFWIVNLKVREVEIHRSRARDTCFKSQERPGEALAGVAIAISQI